MLRTAFRVIAFAALVLLPGVSAALGYPSKPVRMIVGFSPAAAPTSSRASSRQKLSEAWGQPVIVENRPGASATIGADLVAKAPPDGYTLSMGQLTPNAIAPALMPKLPYNAARDFVPIILVGTSPNILVVNPSVAAKDVAELAALAKIEAGKLTYASSGQGSLQHIAAEMFKSVAGVDIVHVRSRAAARRWSTSCRDRST
jgi:tripartite-type tricarboxylate transporter receptor subunit TctC